MKTVNMKKAALSVAIVLLLFAGSLVYSHCQIPCGIYNDPARLDMIVENAATIEKSMKLIEELSQQDKPNMNQLVRWVDNKDFHADDTAEIISYYFMAQRIKPTDKTDAEAYDKYTKQLTLLHEMLVTTMKCKQTTDLANVEKLRSLLEQFRQAYLGEHGHTH